jgi:hypothetical protein
LESPEVHHAHKHHGGGLPRWLELGIAITALVTSISSIVIAVHHGQIMEKLVQANSLPYLQGGFSDTTLEGGEVIALDLFNRGIGPAHETSLRVTVDNKYVTSVKEFIAASLAPDQAADAKQLLRALKNVVKTRFIPGSLQLLVFRVAKTSENAKLWDALQNAEERWGLEYCYCSVFHECWQVRGQWNEPVAVKQCLRDESKEFIP